MDNEKPGIVCSDGASPLIVGCVFTGNQAGAALSFQSDPIISNCLIWGNESSYVGGGLFLDQSNAAISNCTIVDNTALSSGGGIYCFGNSTSTVTNCIIHGNTPTQIGGGSLPVTYSNVQGGYNGEGNIDADPLFADPGEHDYRISPGSPCIDAGANYAVPSGIETDFDGNPRFVDDPFTQDTGLGDPPLVDMGAFEYQPENDCPADVNDDQIVDIDDLFDVLAHWGEGAGPYDVNDDGVVDIDDIFDVLGDWGPCPSKDGSAANRR